MSASQRKVTATRDLLQYMRRLGEHNGNVVLNTARVAESLGLSRSTISTILIKLSKQEGTGVRQVTAGMYEYRPAEAGDLDVPAPQPTRRMTLFLDTVRWLKNRPMTLYSIRDIAHALSTNGTVNPGSVATVLKRAVTEHPELGIELVSRSVYRYNPELDSAVQSAVTEQDIAEWERQDEQAPSAGPMAGKTEAEAVEAFKAEVNGQAKWLGNQNHAEPVPTPAAMPKRLPAGVAERRAAVAALVPELSDLESFAVQPDDTLVLGVVYDVGGGKLLLKDGTGKLYELKPLS